MLHLQYLLLPACPSAPPPAPTLQIGSGAFLTKLSAASYVNVF
jgi:hypothetical protein